MQIAPHPENDSARVAVLREHITLSDPRDLALDDIARAAAEIISVPIGLVSLVDAEEQVFGGCHGLNGVRGTARAFAFCGHTILKPGIFLVPDACADPRFHDNPLVVGSPHVRFYAAVPLTSDEGFRIGALCVIDTAPRRGLNEDQRHHLMTLARTASGILRKMRQQRRTQVALEQALAAAEAAEKAKTLFFASASHELRTPLNAVIGFADLLERQPFGAMPDVRYVDYVRDIRAGGCHLLDLVNDLLDLSSIEAGQRSLSPEPLELKDEIEWMRRMTADMACRNSRNVVFNRDPRVEELRWDRRAFRQTLLNLITNALKYGGDLCTVNVGHNPTIGGIQMTITDNGPGIPPAVRPHLFEPFACGDPEVPWQGMGTGLGLALCKRLVELGSGSIEIKPGTDGTTVVLNLPHARM